MSYAVTSRALALMLAGLLASCGEGGPPPSPARLALASCDVVSDCPPVGACFNRACDARVCIPTVDLVCVCGADGDCDDGNPCTTDSCSLGLCSNASNPGGMGCCADATTCGASNRCQAPATCTNGSCTFVMSATGAADCCNGDSECGTAGASCNNNICTCPGGQKYCTGSRTCVPSGGCCTASDCDSQFSIGAACSVAGNCTYTSCDPGRGDCDQTAPNLAGCETDTSTTVDHCGGCGQSCSSLNMATRTCSGSTCNGLCNANFGDCDGDKLTNGCEVDLRIATAHCGACNRACSTANTAATTCAAGLCTSSCQPGSGNCTRPAAPNPDDGCETNTSADVDHCGMCPTVCPSGNACQVRSCASGSCGFTTANLAGCCSAPADCAVNACQNAACTANTCVLSGKVGVSGCCNIPANCPTQTNPCLINTCASNVCGTMAVGGCTPDMAMPDLSPPPDLSMRDMTLPDAAIDAAVIDATVPADLSVPRDLAIPDLPPAADQSIPLSLTGGGGCVVSGRAPASGLALILLAILAVSARRRRPR